MEVCHEVLVESAVEKSCTLPRRQGAFVLAGRESSDMQCCGCLKWVAEDEIRRAYRVFNFGCSLCLECAQALDANERETNRRIEEQNRRAKEEQR